MIFEVLSDGSAARDRTEKWEVYRQLPSLAHYVLVQRGKSVVEVRSRVGPAWTGLTLSEGLDSAVELPAIGVTLPFRVVYEDVFI